MPLEYMMVLGAFRFSLSTAAYQDFLHKVEYRWVRQDVLGAPPRHQYLGPGEQTIILRGVIYPHYKGGLHQMALMQAQAALGIPLILISPNSARSRRHIVASNGCPTYQSEVHT